MKNYTDITVLVDRSGSMTSSREAMETAFTTFLREHRKIPSTRLTLIQFDDTNDQEVIYTASPIKEASELVISPRGNTPLIDATVKAVDATGSRLRAIAEKDRPARVLMVVITDGHENCSKAYSRTILRERIKHQAEHYNWQFIYLGADPNAVQEAASYGFNRNMSAFFVGEDAGFASMGQAITTNTVAYAASGDVSDLNFTKEQRNKMKSGDSTNSKA